MIYYEENTNIFAYPTSPGPCSIISFAKKSIFLVENDRKNSKNQFLCFRSKLTTKVGQLTSADDSYQTVGLCDYKNVLLSCVQYI